MIRPFFIWLICCGPLFAGLKFEQTHREFVSKPEGEILKVEFPFRNDGSETVTISRYDSGCAKPFILSGPAYLTRQSYEIPRDSLRALSNETLTGTVISSYTYNTNDLSQRSGLVQAGNVFGGAPDSMNWSYDSFGQLSSSASVVHSSTDSRYYAYDDIGNRTISRTGTAISTGGVPINYYGNAAGTSSGGNSLNQYGKVSGGTNLAQTYDADGNLIDDGNLWTYTWDAENRMIKAETKASSVSFKQKWLYAYDCHGRMIVRSRYNWDASTDNWGAPESYEYLYDGWNRIGSVVNYNLQQDEYLWGLDVSGTMRGAGGVGGMLMWQGTTDAFSSGGHNYRYYPVYDGGGNVSQLINDAGAVAAHWEYDAFGNTLRSLLITSDWDAPVNHFGFGFSTKSQLPSVDLYYYGFRLYKPQLGTWLTRDPLAESGGLNLNCFLENRPTGSIDSLGLSGQDCPCKKDDIMKAINEGSKASVEAGRDDIKNVPQPLQAASEGREFGGKVCCDQKTGKVIMNPPQPSQSGENHNGWVKTTTEWHGESIDTVQDTKPCPTGSSQVGSFHSHPSGSAVFSMPDQKFVITNDIPLGLGTEGNPTKVLEPVEGNTAPPGGGATGVVEIKGGVISDDGSVTSDSNIRQDTTKNDGRVISGTVSSVKRK